jgi:hypothetical protein
LEELEADLKEPTASRVREQQTRPQKVKEEQDDSDMTAFNKFVSTSCRVFTMHAVAWFFSEHRGSSCRVGPVISLRIL